MLFVPPSMPFMDPVPEAEAAPMDSPADAITDLSLVSISKKNNRSDRNSITLSWSEPNDNGSPIVFYHVQVHSISGSGWVTLENNVYGTTYTHDNGDQGVATGYQYSYRVFAIASDGCNGNTSNFVDNCNESNILHVVSLPDAASGTPTSQCNNSALDDCGYFSTNFTFESLGIASSGSGTTINPGDTIQITPTVTWEGNFQGTPIINVFGQIKFPDGTVKDQINWSGIFTNSANSVDYNAETITLSTWNVQFYTNTNWPVGQYTTTFTVDSETSFNETNESDNVITGTFTVAAPADTTPPVLVGLQNITMNTNSTSGAPVTFIITATDNVNATSGPTCSPPSGSNFSVGTTTVTCTASDAAENEVTGSFIVTINHVTVTPLTINSLVIYQNTNATDGTADFWRYHVIGDAPASTNLTFEPIRPDGTVHYEASAGTGDSAYDHDGLLYSVGPPANKYGTWTLKICAPEHNMCVQQNFTIDEPAAADTTPPPTSASGTFTITDGTDGGDCTQIGTWNSGSKTCSVTATITGNIIIGSNGITLDGNGKTFTGIKQNYQWQGINYSGNALLVLDKSNVTIKNFQFTKSWAGYGFVIIESDNVLVSGNSFTTSGGKSGGLQVGENSSNVQVTNNNFTVPSSALGVYFAGTGVSVTGNTFSGSQTGEWFQLRSDSPTTVSGNTFNGIASNKRGLAIYPVSGTGSEQVGGHTITGNTFSGSGIGIIFFNSGSNTVTGNTFNGLSHAIDFGTCCGGSLTNSNTFSGNTFSGNNYNYYPSEPEGDTTFPAETTAIIGSANYLAQTNQQAHQYSGNTPVVYVTFNEDVPTMGSLVNIIAVFPNAQSGVSLNSVNVPYTLTYPGGIEEGTLTHRNTSNLYDMVLSINNAPVAGHYVFQTELISTSFDVYDPNSAEGQQAAEDATEETASTVSTITMEIINQADDKFFINESFTIQGNWNNPGQSNQVNTSQCHVWVSSAVYQSGGAYEQCTTSFPLYIMYYHPGTGTESRSTTLYTTLQVDSSGDYSITLDLDDIAYAGPGHYMIRAEPSVNDVFAHQDIWLIEQNPNASIILTSDITTLDRKFPNVRATITITYQNLNPVADYIKRTPDGVEHDFGAFATNTSGVNTVTVGPSDTWVSDLSVDSFDVIIDDGNTRGEITIQIIDTRVLMTISSVEPSFQGNQWFARIIGGSNSTSSQVIEFSIFDMLGSLIDTHSYQTNPDGSFDTVWAIPDNLSYGSYNVTSNIHYPNCDVWQSLCVSFVIFDWQGDQDTTPAEYPTVTATAYLNNTSSTGRTLHLDVNNMSLIGEPVTGTATQEIIGINAMIYDATPPYFPGSGSSFYKPNGVHTLRICFGDCSDHVMNYPSGVAQGYSIIASDPNSNCQTIPHNPYCPTSLDYQFPIPEDWESGSYEVRWEGYAYQGYGTTSVVDLATTAVTIPALPPADLTPPTINSLDFYCPPAWGQGGFAGCADGGGNGPQFSLTGNKDASTSLTVEAIKPGGLVFNTWNIGLSSDPAYQTNYTIGALLANYDQMVSGTWTMKVCATGYGVCAEQNFTVSVEGWGIIWDTTPPVIATENKTNSTTNSAGWANYYYGLPIVTDDGQQLPDPTCIPPPGSLFPIGTTTVTCTATDNVGNVGTASFTVTIIYTGTEEEPEEEVEPEVDTTPPVLVVSNDISTQTYNSNGKLVYYANPSATDIGGIVGLSCNYPSGIFFSVGTTTVTCTAVDASGLTTVKSFTITVVYDVTPDTTLPVFVQVSDVQLSTTIPDGLEYNYAIPQVSDNIGVTIGPTCTPESGSIFPIGTTNVICTASDAAGNQQSTTFSVTVINPNATGGIPTFEPIENITQEADVPNGKQLIFSIPTATDDETELPSVFCTPSPGYLFPVGVTTVACTAIDEDGNQGAVTFTVTITPQTQQQTSDQTADLSITTVESVTLAGDSVSSVSAGGLAYFTTSLVTNSTGNAFVTVYVQDADSTALGVGHFKSVIGMGDSDLTLGFRMPSDAISGIANIYVNVWTDETMTVSITDEVDANVQIIGIDPEDVSTFNYWFEGLPTGEYLSPPGFSAADIVDDATSYWKGSPAVDTFIPWSGVDSYVNSKVPFGNDFVTDLTFNEVEYDDANLNIYWVKEFGGTTTGIAPISNYPEQYVDDIFISLGDSNFYGTWQPYSEKYLASVMKHEIGHVIGFGHEDEDPQTNPDNLMNTAAPGYEYGIVEETHTLTGNYTLSVPIFTSRDVTNFNYHVSTDNEAGFSVYFVPDLETSTDSYPGCFAEDVMSTGAQSCNNVEMGSGLVITIPLTDETAGVLTDVTVKLQENFDGFQTLSNVATTQEAPIMTTATQSTKFELLEVSEVEVEHESVFIDGINFLEIPDITLAQDTVEFSVVGWIEPDFSKGSQDLTIVSKYESFNLFLVGESFQIKNSKVSIVPATLNFSVYDGIEWHTIHGNTEISEDWHQIAAVVDDSVATLYLDGKFEGKVKLEREVPLGYSLEAGKCQQKSCIVDVKMLTSDADLTVGAYVAKKMVKTCCDDDGFMKTVGIPTPVDHFSGVISSIERFSDAFSEKQILKLYERDKNYFEKGTVTDSVSVGTESPALSDSECLDLAKERGLEALAQVTHTLVCQFPFNAVIPLNSSILWIETHSSPGGPYHMMRSVDNLFAATVASFALMDFNEPEFTYGVYEYVDDLNKSLTGKIVIAKQLKPADSRISTLPTGSSTMEIINVSRNSAGPDCGIDNSCYEPFAVSVDVNEEVTWKNLDSYSHTVTSGTPEDGPDGVFDSGVLANYRYFSHTFYEAGIYDYYCTLHPWMQGMIVVGEI